jgi:hypothetical protein
VLTPAPSPFSDGARVWIGPSQKVQGGRWAAHRGLLKSLIESMKWPGSNVTHNPAGPGPFIMSDASSSATLAGALKLFTAMAGDRVEAVGVPAGAERGLGRSIPFQRTTLKDAPEGPKPPAVVEAYRRPNKKTYLNIDGSLFHGQVKYERIFLLRTGGRLSASYSEGIRRLAGGRQGGSAYRTALREVEGRWEQRSILRQEGQPEQVYEREKGSLRFGDEVWTPMPRVDGPQAQGAIRLQVRAGGPLSTTTGSTSRRTEASGRAAC